MGDKKHFLALHTVFILNENILWLEEFIIYYTHIGVTHFYLYDNEGTDGYYGTQTHNRRNIPITVINTPADQEILEQIICKYPNMITIVKWQPIKNGKIIYDQIGALNHFITNYGNEVMWVILMDLDEFLFSPSNNHIIDYIKNSKKDVSGFIFQQKRFVDRSIAETKYITQDYRCVNIIIPTKFAPKNIIRCDDFISAKYIHWLTLKGKTITVPPEVFRFNHYNLCEGSFKLKWIVDLLNLKMPFALTDADDGMKRYLELFS